mgnify:CR=1 FL=1
MKILLKNRSLLKISGKDAEEFIQNQFTNDINKLDNEFYIQVRNKEQYELVKELCDFKVMYDNKDIVEIADKEDIWFHVKGVPGSHVVIRVRENLPTETVIKLAAQLAKKNSKASKESNVTVVYCQRRFVKKPK